MYNSKITNVTPLVANFYARCFSFPYDEMNHELQHLFRMMERNDISAENYEQMDQVLRVVNQYQGEDIKDLRNDYVLLFAGNEDHNPFCPLIATEFLSLYGKHYDPDSFSDLIFDSGIPVNPDEPVETITNYLEYLSLLLENSVQNDSELSLLNNFMDEHILNWMPLFCEVLYKSSNVNFYREVAVGLKDFLLWLHPEY
jgi:TorA maturation chaperone TorD